MSLSELAPVEKYLANNVVPPLEKPHICVDGRIPFASALSGGLAYAGASLGTLEAALAVNNRLGLVSYAEQVTDAVVQGYLDLGLQFYMHTDDHTDKQENTFFSQFEKLPDLADLNPTHPALGCAHGANPLNPEFAPQYGVDPEDMLDALNHLKGVYLPKGAVSVQRYKGPHAEQGAIILTGRTTINHDNPILKGQYFVYDEMRHQEFLAEQLYPKLKLPGLQLEDLVEAGSTQTIATLRILARKQPDQTMRTYRTNADRSVFDIEPGFLKAA